MEVQLQELLDSIKKDGIKEAETRAEEIITKAQSDADAIKEEARKNAESIIESARQEAARLEASGKAALEQAGRDLLLSLKGSITRMLEAIVNDSVGEAMRPGVLEEGILAVLGSFSKESGEMQIGLDNNSFKQMAQGLEKKLAGELGSGVTIKPLAGIDKGFRVTEKDGSGYYDFSASGLSEMICRFLNPRLEELLKNALDS